MKSKEGRNVQQVRCFVPSSRTVGRTSVPVSWRFVLWVRGGGCVTVFNDGCAWPSDYNLREVIERCKPGEAQEFIETSYVPS